MGEYGHVLERVDHIAIIGGSLEHSRRSRVRVVGATSGREGRRGPQRPICHVRRCSALHEVAQQWRIGLGYPERLLK